MRPTYRAVLAVCLVLSLTAGVAVEGAVSAADTLPDGSGTSSQRALLLLEDGAEVADVTQAVEQLDGRVFHVFHASALIVDLPVEAPCPAGVRAVHRGNVQKASLARLDGDARRAAKLWNGLRDDGFRLDTSLSSQDLQAELVGDALVAPAPSRALRAAESSGDPTPGPTQTSEFMIGRVAVGILLPESDGSVDASTEDWTEEERGLVLSEITAALDWWAGLEPRADLTFVYDTAMATPISTGYEPIQHPYAEQSLWIGDVMTKKGYSGLSYFDQVRQYNQDLRETHDTDWAFTLFVVDSSNDGDNRFADGAFAYAYLGGPFAVLTSGSNGYGIDNLDAVAAHEIGHVFHALDQYYTARQSCERRSGYLGVENQNSQYGNCASDEPSLMRGQVWPYRSESLDHYARGQIGWRDTDGDGVFDPVDTSFELSSVDFVTDTTYTNVFTFTGRVRDVPHASPLRSSVTINTIEAVAYRVAGSEWTQCEPQDGGFDSRVEDFTFTTPPLPTGDLDVELRVVGSAGNVVTQTLATVASVDPLDDVLETTLMRIGPQAMDRSSDEVVYSGRGTSPVSTFVAAVYYRIDDGEWRLVPAEDGAYDEAEEAFNLTLSLDDLGPGDHLLEVYAEDGEGNPDTSPARDTVHVPQATCQLFFPLVLVSPPGPSNSAATP